MNNFNLDLSFSNESFNMTHYKVRELAAFVRAGQLWVMEYAIDAYCQQLPVSRAEAEIQIAWMCRHA